MRSVTRGAATLAVSALVLAAAAACGSGDRSAAADGVSVVASTDVYGDIAATIGGQDVDVTAVISDPSADPHSYEASARTQLAVARADVVIENGGGYDDFMDTLLSATDSAATVVNAVRVSGRQTDAAGFNEHVWYDVGTMRKVADSIAGALADADPAHSDRYRANAADLGSRLGELTAAEQAARSTTEGAGVAVTEPVPGYLLDALGAVNRTPQEFTASIEEGNGVSPAVLQQTLDLFSAGSVVALVYNEQASGPVTERVLQAARDAGVAVVPVTETLPDGESYLSWMQGNLDDVVAALSS